MASNESILKDMNWSNDSDPGRYSLFTGLINPAMDAARKDEIEAWEEWKRVHYIYSVIRHDMTVGLFYNKVRYSFDELYTIFKNRNS